MANGGMTSGWRLARLFGITVRIHASWLIIFGLLTVSLAGDLLPLSNLAGGGPWWKGTEVLQTLERFHERHPGMDRGDVDRLFGIQRWPAWHYWFLGALGAIGLFVCVLAHEIAHSLVARRAGIPVEGITLFVFGGVSRLREEAASPGVEFKVAAVGPLMSLAIAAACGALYYGLGDRFPAQSRSLLYYFMFINFALVVFNLLPGFPLDGGRLLRAILWKHFGDLARATAWAASAGRFLGGGFVVVGALLAWQEFASGGGISLGPVWWILIGLFLRHAAKVGYQQMALREAFTGLTARHVIRSDIVSVPPDLTLEQLVDTYFYSHRFRSFPVLEGDRFIGMISLKDLQAVPRAEWARRTVRETMHQVREENRVRPEDDLASVFRKMMEEDKGHLPVVEDGRLRGMVTRHDIMTLLQLRTDLGGPAPGRRSS